MEELVVISGKGGAGKTSVTAALAVLAERPVIADCDVDAPDLHLVLSPAIQERHEFRGGHKAVIREADCTDCGVCLAYCRFGAVNLQDDAAGGTSFAIDPVVCEGCGVCVRFCPEQAIDFPERRCGEWMVSETRCGPMVHVRLDAGSENSGKLVTTVRREALRIAETERRSLVLVDGPPGIGCPVIASVAGASLVLIVTEPTLAGEHDMERALALTRHFNIPTAMCVNKWDLNPELAGRIEARARQAGAHIAGRIRYDGGVTQAQMREQTIVETAAPCVEDVRLVWNRLQDLFSLPPPERRFAD